MESQLPPLTAERLDVRTTLRNDHLGINSQTPEQKELGSSEALRPEMGLLKIGLHLLASIALRPWEKDGKMTMDNLPWACMEAWNRNPSERSNILS